MILSSLLFSCDFEIDRIRFSDVTGTNIDRIGELSKEVLKDNDEDVQALFNISLMYYNQRKYAESLTYLNEVLKKDSSCEKKLLKGNLLIELKDYDKAFTFLDGVNCKEDPFYSKLLYKIYSVTDKPLKASYYKSQIKE